MNEINIPTRQAVQRLRKKRSRTVYLAKDLPGEKWLPIPNYEGWYEVSNLGRVKRIRPAVNNRTGNILRFGMRSGYKYANLCKDGIIKSFALHELVCLAFIGKRPKGFVTNHKDGNRINNRPENLEHVTQSENMYHAHRMGMCPVPYGEKHYWSKLNGKQVSEIKQLFRETKLSHRVIGLKFGVHTATVQAIKEGRSWKQIK